MNEAERDKAEAEAEGGQSPDSSTFFCRAPNDPSRY